MGRRNNASIHSEDWTNEKIFDELRRHVDMETFGSYFRDQPIILGCQAESGDFIRAETRLYRQSWIHPLIDELQSRLIKNP